MMEVSQGEGGRKGGKGGKLDVQLYEALKKGLYKPAAWFKGILFPLCEVGLSPLCALLRYRKADLCSDGHRLCREDVH